MLKTLFSSLLALVLFTAAAFAQSQNASLAGQVSDQSGAFVPKATVTITSTERNLSSSVQSDDGGRFSFPNLTPGTYDLNVAANGFKSYVQRGILLLANQSARIDTSLQLGDAATKIEVTADVAQLNVDNGGKQEGVAPTIINQLPLLVSAGTPRNAVQFISFLPGVNTGSSPQAFNARINGGLKMGDEAVMDGVSMQEGTMSQSGMVSFFDFPTTPDMVSEVRVLTSSYEPQYGVTTGGVLMVTTRSGSDQFHGGGLEYFRNKSLNALQFTNQRGPGDQRPKDNENQFGGFIGGPVKLPFLPFIWGSSHKTYFFHDQEYLRSLGGATRPLRTIPSLKNRAGDFSDWGTPIYDPQSTVITNGVISRTPFVGNIIPANRQSALALQWMKFLPTPTSDGPTNNYLAQPVSDGILANVNHFLYKIDHYWGDNDHFFLTIWRQKSLPNEQCELPVQLCTSNPSNPQDAWVNRFNWDHIFTPTLLSHFAAGYLNRNEGYGSVPAQDPSQLPRIPNAAAYNASPAANFSGNGFDNYSGYGNTAGYGPLNKSTRPSYIANELITWVRGAHTLKVGGEFRHLQEVFRNNGNQSGTVGFSQFGTALPGINSGNPFASFLSGAVDNGNLQVYNVAKYGPMQRAYHLYAGDTWQVTSKLTVNLGLRWDRFSPSFETGNYNTFLDFGPNPGAGNRPGRLVFSGDKWGDASAGKRFPEEIFNGAFGPRVGLAYRLGGNTVIRAGYGVFYTQAFYPGWGGGMSLDGFNPQVAFNSSLGGYQPAFNLDSGFPAYSKEPNISTTADNGTNGPQYRPTDGNHLSYTQQFNLTLEHKIGGNSLVGLAFVGNKGTHLPSQLQPLNVLNPSLLSMGSALNAVFEPGQTSLNGVNAPYAGWAESLSNGSCAPTVGQALLPFPQYCGGLTGVNENRGTSFYHSLQAKYEKQFAGGLYFGFNYTLSRLKTDASSTTQSTAGYGGIGAVINPYQGDRNYSLSPDDITHTAAVLAVYELPVGKGKRWMNSGGVSDKVLGGWSLSSSMKFTSGMPYYFRNDSVCGLPSQFRAQCIPTITGDNVFAQSWGSVDVNKPLFNASAFEDSTKFNGFYLGNGPRVSSFRGSPYRDTNLSIIKSISLTERLKVEVRAEMFNIFNNHYFTCDGTAFGDCTPFNNDPSSTNFGVWNGTVSAPRNIQLVGRITF
ncbi:MAG: carboxypeptidase regulatory-like domain-containing protein [Bryobacteraceae bacterium]